MALVGLDVHRAQTVAAVLDPVNGELRVQRLRGEPDRVVPEFLEELDRPVRAVYEAGPTGFVLARVAEERGLDVRVMAPGSIPRASGDRVKTDRRDAKRLVRLFAAGELSFAFVPSETDERFRDLVRCVEDARKDLMRSRHRLSKFLLRRGVRFPGKAWTQPHEQWLLALRFDDALSQATFVDYLSAVQALAQRRRALICVLEEAVPNSSHARVVERLRCSAGSTRSRPPGCALKSETSDGSPSPHCCRASSVSCRASTPLTIGACRARSPRPAQRTPGGYWSRPLTTTATSLPSAWALQHARTARTPGSCRSPGAPNGACMNAGYISANGAAS